MPPPGRRREDYLEGVGEDLPLADGVADVVTFFQSLHHVPAPRMRDALAEAARVLRPGGLVFVAEPIAEGAFFELVRPLDDETEVRRQAFEALGDAPSVGLEPVDELEFLNPIAFRDIDGFPEGRGRCRRRSRAALRGAEGRAARPLRGDRPTYRRRLGVREPDARQPAAPPVVARRGPGDRRQPAGAGASVIGTQQ